MCYVPNSLSKLQQSLAAQVEERKLENKKAMEKFQEKSRETEFKAEQLKLVRLRFIFCGTMMVMLTTCRNTSRIKMLMSRNYSNWNKNANACKMTTRAFEKCFKTKASKRRK